MGKSAADGVVDEFGRVFDKTKNGGQAIQQGLYVADASIIPTALGVNPSLTITALSLRIVENMINDLP
jgi:cholesterol oxidase